jgi:hypothetical protein
MQTPAASDPSFKAFLEKLQEQNNRGFATQLIQLKAEREIAGEDGDKREEQLDDVISSLKDVRNAVTGSKLDIDLTPLVNIGENQTKLLQELSKEASLTRKLTEGSVEYDREAAQYRNKSGRDIESKVSGKTSKDGGFIDFETARDTLSGQGKRVKEDNAFSLKPINYTPGKTVAAAVGGKGSPAADNEEEDKSKYQGFFKELESGFKFFMTDGLSEKPGQGIFQTPSKDVEKKDREADVSSPRQVNPEADNIASTGEIQADVAKSDLEISKQMLETTKAQLNELKEIRKALAPGVPKDLVEQKSTPTPSVDESDSGGGLGLGGALAGIGGLAKKAGGAIVKGAKVVGKGALTLGGGIAKFAASGAGKALGATAAVGLGAYTAYKGFTAAEDSKDAKLAEVQTKVDSGEMKPEEAAAARKEIGNTATVEKSGAVGEGTGMAGGAIAGGIAGAKLGAAIGSIIPGAGTVIGAGIGTIAGGALGAFAGSKAGKYVGEKVGSGINTVKEFFGSKTDTPGAKTGAAVTGRPTESNTTTDIQFSEMEFAKKDPDNYKKFVEFRDKRTEEIAKDQAKKFGKKEPSSIDYEIAETKAKVESIKKFQKEIESSGAGKVETKNATLNKEQQTKAESKPGVSKTEAVAPQRTEAGVAAFDKAYQEARSDGKSVKESKEIAFKARNAADTAAQPNSDIITASKSSGADGKLVTSGSTPTAAKTNSIAQGVAASIVGDVPEIGTGKTSTQVSPSNPAAIASGKAKLDRMRSDMDTQGEKLRSEATRLGIDPNTAKGTMEGGVLTKITDSSGKEHSIEVSEKDKASVAGAREMRAMNENSAKLAAAASRNMGSDVNKTSTENIDLSRGASGGGSNNTVVSNNVSSNNTTKIVPMKANPRPEYTGSSLDRYTNRITVY